MKGCSVDFLLYKVWERFAVVTIVGFHATEWKTFASGKCHQSLKNSLFVLFTKDVSESQKKTVGPFFWKWLGAVD
jgi:hypothetical protein